MIKELVLSIVIAWLFAKVLKTIIDWVKEKKISWKVLFYDGGMPSLHTIAVVSLTTGLFLETGFSAVFILSVVLALIIINDALGVRRITQEQSRAINRLAENKPDFKKLNEHVGHKPLDVLVSLVLGIIIPVIIYTLF